MWKERLRHVTSFIPVQVRKSSIPLPGADVEREVTLRLSKSEWWCSRRDGEWRTISAPDLAHLVVLRFHNIEFALTELERGRVWTVTPSGARIRMAVSVPKLVRIDDRRDSAYAISGSSKAGRRA
jgi:hypothetical protein